MLNSSLRRFYETFYAPIHTWPDRLEKLQCYLFVTGERKVQKADVTVKGEVHPITVEV